jgi:hypothetical protein
MREYLDLIHSDTGTLRLFRHHDLMNGTLYGYHLHRYGHCADFDLYRTEEGFGSAAAARAHGLSQLHAMARHPR